jgi:hypothetical protein
MSVNPEQIRVPPGETVRGLFGPPDRRGRIGEAGSARPDRRGRIGEACELPRCVKLAATLIWL